MSMAWKLGATWPVRNRIRALQSPPLLCSLRSASPPAVTVAENRCQGKAHGIPNTTAICTATCAWWRGLRATPLAVLPCHTEGRTAGAESGGLRLHRAAGGDHRDRIGVRVAADRGAVGGAARETDRAEVRQPQHAARAGGGLRDPLGRAARRFARPLGRREGPAARAIRDLECEAATACTHLGGDAVTGNYWVQGRREIDRELGIHLVPRVVRRRAAGAIGVGACLLHSVGRCTIDADPE